MLEPISLGTYYISIHVTWICSETFFLKILSHLYDKKFENLDKYYRRVRERKWLYIDIENLTRKKDMTNKPCHKPMDIL